MKDLRVTARLKKYALIVAACLFGALFIGLIEVPAPPDLRGPLSANGRITDCDFGALGRNNSHFFLGVTLDATDAPYLRFNPPIRERDNYESLCTRKPHVRINYHAVKRLIGPVRFWIDDFNEG